MKSRCLFVKALFLKFMFLILYFHLFLQGSIFAMLLPNNISTTNYPTNEMWCDSDCRNFLKQLVLAEIILYIFISILIIIGNTLVLLATWRERSLRQPNKCFIACLAVADLLVGIFIGPVKVYRLFHGWQLDLSIHFCRFGVWIDTLVLTASVYTLMLISFERYLKISKPLQYRSRMTTSKSLKIILIIWLISAVFATYAATPDSGNYGFLATGAALCPHYYRENRSKRDGYMTFLYISVIFLPAIVILIMYALIFVVADKRQRMLRNGELDETSTGQNQRSVLRQDLKIVRMLLIVVVVFFFCWLPLSITYLSVIYNQNAVRNWSFRSFFIYYFVIYLLPLITSLCNPIIYACLDQTYREAFKHLFQKMMCRTRSDTQQPPAEIELRPLRNN